VLAGVRRLYHDANRNQVDDRKDNSPFVFAGLWEGRKDPSNGEWLHTCTIITGEPNEFLAQIHTRMPVIPPEEHHDSWLSGEAGKEILVPYPAVRMKAWPVSPRVNSPENNDPEIIVPIEVASLVRPENSPLLL
jgi:putative SOS response-associated peptidase YedK